MKAYSQDLRKRVLQAAEEGMPHKEIVRIFKVSASLALDAISSNNGKKVMFVPKRSPDGLAKTGSNCKRG